MAKSKRLATAAMQKFFFLFSVTNKQTLSNGIILREIFHFIFYLDHLQWETIRERVVKAGTLEKLVVRFVFITHPFRHL